jgi:hypothetical protein
MAKAEKLTPDPLLDGIENTILEEPNAGDAPLAGASAASGPLAEAAVHAGVAVPDELELARRAEAQARERLAHAEHELAEARRELAAASLYVTELQPMPTLEECNRAAAVIEAKLAAEREEQSKRERVVFIQRRIHPPLPGVVL